LAPLGATLWLTHSLFRTQPQFYASNEELDLLSKSLAQTGRELYQRSRETLKQEAASGRVKPERYRAEDRAKWPQEAADFAEGGEAEDFALAGKDGDRLDYMVRHGAEVWV